jgi:polyisoprenoid-binding protein YceI
VVELDAAGNGRFRLDVDMTTLEAESDFITSFAKYDLLEVGSFPHASIVARVEPVPDEPGALSFTGNVELHGVERGIVFRGTLTRTGERVHIHAVFKMSRAQFGIRAREYDWIIQDDLRITLDLRAGPEKVTVQPVP